MASATAGWHQVREELMGMMSKFERRAQLDEQVSMAPLGSIQCQQLSSQGAHLTAMHQGCRHEGLLSNAAAWSLRLYAEVQSHPAPEKPQLTSGLTDSACPAAQVKNLEMQQDWIQRAIETKQQQLKPLEAEVRGRSRQATEGLLLGTSCPLCACQRCHGIQGADEMSGEV